MRTGHEKAAILAGAFAAAAVTGAGAQDIWLYRRPAIPVPPPVFILPPDDKIATDFDLETCILHAIEQQRPAHRLSDTAPVKTLDVPETSMPERTYYMDFETRRGILSGAMVVVDHRKEGRGSLSVSFSRLHETDTDLDANTPRPAGEGVIARVAIAREDVGPRGDFNVYAGPKASAAVIARVRNAAFEIVDTLRVCMGSGPDKP